MGQLHALRTLVAVQIKLYLREPVVVLFSVLLAPMLLVLMGFVFGNDPVAMLGNRGQMSVNVPSFAAIVIGVVGLATLPIETSTRREAGVLRRLRATPLRPLTYIVGDVLVNLILALLGILLLFLLGLVVYQVEFTGHVLPLVAGVLLCIAAFLAIGYVLAGLAPSARVAVVVGNVLLYPMMIFSGTTVPLEIMPQAVRNVSAFIPLTHVVTLLRGLWFGESFSDHLTEVAVLGGILLVGTAVAALTFRWE